MSEFQFLSRAVEEYDAAGARITVRVVPPLRREAHLGHRMTVLDIAGLQVNVF